MDKTAIPRSYCATKCARSQTPHPNPPPEGEGLLEPQVTFAPRYHVNLFWSVGDDCWIADVPDLPGCSAHGPTPEAAAHEVQIAIELWLECARDHGDPIPEPRYRPAI